MNRRRQLSTILQQLDQKRQELPELEHAAAEAQAREDASETQSSELGQKGPTDARANRRQRAADRLQRQRKQRIEQQAKVLRFPAELDGSRALAEKHLADHAIKATDKFAAALAERHDWYAELPFVATENAKHFESARDTFSRSTDAATEKAFRQLAGIALKAGNTRRTAAEWARGRVRTVVAQHCQPRTAYAAIGAEHGPHWLPEGVEQTAEDVRSSIFARINRFAEEELLREWTETPAAASRSAPQNRREPSNTFDEEAGRLLHELRGAYGKRIPDDCLRQIAGQLSHFDLLETLRPAQAKLIIAYNEQHREHSIDTFVTALVCPNGQVVRAVKKRFYSAREQYEKRRNGDR